MGIRKSAIGVGASFGTVLMLVIEMVLLWSTLSDMISQVNVGIFMFFSMEFWQLMILIGGMLFFAIWVPRVLFNAKFGGKAQ